MNVLEYEPNLFPQGLEAVELLVKDVGKSGTHNISDASKTLLGWQSPTLGCLDDKRRLDVVGDIPWELPCDTTDAKLIESCASIS